MDSDVYYVIVVLNFGKPFRLKDMEVNEAMRHCLEIQGNALRMNMKFVKIP